MTGLDTGLLFVRPQAAMLLDCEVLQTRGHLEKSLPPSVIG